MKEAAKDHPITVEPHGGRVTVSAGGVTIADSGNALRLREASYKPVVYLPRADVRMDLLRPTDHATHCPYKGDANYFSIETGEASVNNAVWSYEAPFDYIAVIKDHLAFYATKVTIEETQGP